GVEGQLKPGAKVITRTAPGYGRNPGGKIEAVVEKGSVNIMNDNMSVCPQEIGKAQSTATLSEFIGEVAPSVVVIETQRKNRM
ncbi:MAG TPA: hypothetical protein PLD88_13965, partial [Candidatus Berkiella sp.]|nr:hypothetical protein [Candidatus Berkiella sp.]